VPTPVVVVGAGAAGLATAVFAKRLNPSVDVTLVDGARKPGAKILVSGGGRCNVTNRVVTEADFEGGSRAAIRQVLRAFPASETVAFFRSLDVSLHEEAGGKLFPDTNRARDVLEALLREVQARGVRLVTGRRVVGVAKTAAGFRVTTSEGDLDASRLVLGTGGCSLPKTGSDGAGFRFATSLGHSIVPTTPALAPLVLAEGTKSRNGSARPDPSGLPMHPRLSGVSHDAELTVRIDGRIARRLRGSLLWTHFGVSGPVILDASRHWARARLEGRPVALTMSVCPGQSFEEVDARLAGLRAGHATTSIVAVVAGIVPASLAAALADEAHLDGAVALAHLTRDDRRRLVHALTALPLPVADTRGYQYAEATAGGVPLGEISPATMESRLCEGLYLVGEMLDVDGRIGGFNFQWAWATGFLAGRAAVHATG
jgi:hypothetical protein